MELYGISERERENSFLFLAYLILCVQKLYVGVGKNLVIYQGQ